MNETHYFRICTEEMALVRLDIPKLFKGIKVAMHLETFQDNSSLQNMKECKAKHLDQYQDYPFLPFFEIIVKSAKEYRKINWFVLHVRECFR